MFASLQLLNTPLNPHFLHQQQQEMLRRRQAQSQQSTPAFYPGSTNNANGSTIAGDGYNLSLSLSPMVSGSALLGTTNMMGIATTTSNPLSVNPNVNANTQAELCLPPNLLYPPQSHPSSASPSMSASAQTPSQPHLDGINMQDLSLGYGNGQFVESPKTEEFDMDRDQESDDEGSGSSGNMKVIPLKRRSPSLPPSSKSNTSSTHTGPKKSRTASTHTSTGERISSKDFIPPDVSGLSKREARLVKNRAAAFLSRQRKREEFEALEIRVQDLETENAQLRGQNSSNQTSAAAAPSKRTPANSQSQDHEQLTAEIARLKTELTTSTRRCTLLEQDLSRVRAQYQREVSKNATGKDVETESGNAKGRKAKPGQKRVKNEPFEDEFASPSLSSSGQDEEEDTPASSEAGDTTSTNTSKSTTPTPSTPTQTPQPLATKEKASGLMMALLLLLAPVLSPTSSTRGRESSHHDQDELPNRFDFSSGVYDNGGGLSLSFDHLLSADMGVLGWSGAAAPTATATPSSAIVSSKSGTVLDADMDLDDVTTKVGLKKASEDAMHVVEKKREVELEVELVRDPTRPSRVRVKIVDPASLLSSTDGSSNSQGVKPESDVEGGLLDAVSMNLDAGSMAMDGYSFFTGLDTQSYGLTTHFESTAPSTQATGSATTSASSSPSLSSTSSTLSSIPDFLGFPPTPTSTTPPTLPLLDPLSLSLPTGYSYSYPPTYTGFDKFGYDSLTDFSTSGGAKSGAVSSGAGVQAGQKEKKRVRISVGEKGEWEVEVL